MTTPADWIEPRHSLPTINRFCAEITAGVSGYCGCAHKRQEADGAHPRSFRWVRPLWLAEEVRTLDHVVGSEALDPYFRRYGHRSPPYPVETMVRLAACAEVPLTHELRFRKHWDSERQSDVTDVIGKPQVRGGAVDDLSTVMGLSVDIDVSLRRDDGDTRNYCPSFIAAADLVADLVPTYAIDGGGGLIVVWLFATPHTDIAAAHALGADVVEHVHERCAANAWDFDSPAPLAAWCKAPGTWSAKYGRVIEVIEEGERSSFDALRSAIPRYRRHHSHGYSHTTTVPDTAPRRPGVKRWGRRRR